MVPKYFADPTKHLQAIPLLAGASAIATAAAFWALRRKPDARQGGGDGLKADDQAHLCTAIDHAYDIIVLFDRKGRILNANKAAEEAYGRTREELCRLHAWDIRLPQDLPIARTQLAQALRRESIEFETEHRRKDGTRFPVEVRSRTVRIAGKEQIISVIRDITQRRQAEAALRDREDLFTAIFKRTSDGIILVDPDSGRFVEFNDSAARLLGYTRDEFAQKTIFEVATMDPDVVRANMEKMMRAEGFAFQASHRHKDGHLLTRTIRGQAIQAKGRRFISTVWIDMTETLKATQELERLGRIIEQVPVSIQIANLNLEMEYANPFFYSMSGYSSEEVIGKDPGILKSGLTPKKTYQELWSTLRESKVWRGELVNRKKNGEIYTEEATIFPITDRHGRLMSYVAVKEDVTVLRDYQRSLTESQRRFETIFKNAAVGMFVVSPSGEVIAANAFAERKLGYGEGELLGSKIGAFDARPQILFPCESEFSSGLYHLTRRDGTSFYGELSRTVERDSSGEPARVICILKDVTVAVEGRRLLERYNAELAAEVAKRTAELVASNEKVSSLLEKERHSSAIKSRFISLVSHEFRTPMTTANGSAELLINHFDRFGPEKRIQILHRIRDSLLKLDDILSDVLTLNRVESNRVEPKYVGFDLAALVGELIEESRLTAGRGHRLELARRGERSSVVSDPSLVHIIIGNLISNAVRYSEAGTTVVVTVGVQADGFWCAVEDRGIGVPALDRQRIFEAFERGENAGNISGTGLGLTISRRLAERLGGSLVLEPASAGGSIFTVRLPQGAAPLHP